MAEFGSRPPVAETYSPSEIRLGFQSASLVYGGQKRLHQAWKALGYVTQGYNTCNKIGRKQGPLRPRCKLGRTPAAGETESVLAEIDASFAAEPDYDLTDARMRTILERRVAENANAHGPATVASSVVGRVSDGQIAYYLKLYAAERPGVDVNRAKRHKRMPQIIAANSAIDSIGFAACTLAVTHVLGPDAHQPDGYVGSKTHAVMSAVLDDMPHGWLHERLQLNVDDTGIYSRAVDGAGHSDKGFISLTRAVPNTAEHERYTLPSAPGAPLRAGEFQAGTTIENSVLTSVAGRCGDFYITAFVTRDEMPSCPGGFLHIEVPGFCTGGHHSGTGHLVFIVRGDGHNREERWSQHFFETVVIPFVERERVDLGWTRGTPVPAHLRALVWMDGKKEQVDLITRPGGFETRLAEALLDVAKHGAARSMVEQGNDVSVCFKLHKLLDKHLTAKLGAACYMKDKVKRLIKAHPNLKLKLTDVDAVAGFCGRLLDVAPRAYSPSNVRNGYVWNGQRSKAGAFPDVQQMVLGTMRRQMPEAEYEHGACVSWSGAVGQGGEHGCRCKVLGLKNTGAKA